ncbi:MAG: alpha/beta hydrolase [Erysipelotrichales bacterium]|nr:alpha/beta hydrolase [Erysipelotrichales bacterium]
MNEKAIEFLSNNQKTIIKGKIFTPEREKKGIIMIVHGMADRFGRYDETTAFFINAGFIVCGHDSIGHGDSATSETKGYIPGKNGYLDLVEDVKLMLDEVIKIYPNLPIYLLGHSMGAAISKIFVSKYGNLINGLMLSGTGDTPLGIGFAIMLTKRYLKKNGEKALATEVDRLVFKNINERFAPARTVSDWLSRDPLMVDKFVNDPKCCFLFTNIGYLNMLKLMKLAGNKKVLKSIPKALPVYIFAGTEDVSTKLGEGTKKFYQRLKKYKMTSVKLELYPDGRHEMLNETNREEVCKDILNWIRSIR